MQADRIMARLLFVQPEVDYAPQTDDDAAYKQKVHQAENALGFSLLFSGVRCVLQYAVLPFLLPLIGVATAAAVPVLLVINLLAMVSIFFSLRRFWRIGYKYRWQYLVVAIAALVILTAFIIIDIQAITAI